MVEINLSFIEIYAKKEIELFLNDKDKVFIFQVFKKLDRFQNKKRD